MPTPQNADVAVHDSRLGMRMASPNMHPTRMAHLADALASRRDASEEVRILASIVRELCHQVERAKMEASLARSGMRRGF